MTVVGPVASSGAAALNFPGWHRDDDASLPGVQVHPTESSVRIPHRRYFNPGDAQRLEVAAYIRPDDTTNPDGPIGPDDSLNIVQKGVREDPDGQWKISILGSMLPVCTFRDNDDGDPDTETPDRIVSAVDGEQLRPGRRYLVRCILEPQSATLRVYQLILGSRVEITDRSRAYDGQATFVIDNDAEVWIGKKPDVTTPADTFAGVVDNVAIKRPPL